MRKYRKCRQMFRKISCNLNKFRWNVMIAYVSLKASFIDFWGTRINTDENSLVRVIKQQFITRKSSVCVAVYMENFLYAEHENVFYMWMVFWSFLFRCSETIRNNNDFFIFCRCIFRLFLSRTFSYFSSLFLCYSK